MFSEQRCIKEFRKLDKFLEEKMVRNMENKEVRQAYCEALHGLRFMMGEMDINLEREK